MPSMTSCFAPQHMWLSNNLYLPKNPVWCQSSSCREQISIMALRKHFSEAFQVQHFIKCSYSSHKKIRNTLSFSQLHDWRRGLLFQELPKVRQLVSSNWYSSQYDSDTKFMFLQHNTPFWTHHISKQQTPYVSPNSFAWQTADAHDYLSVLTNIKTQFAYSWL